MWNKVKNYVYSVLATLAVGGLSALLTAGNREVYQNSAKPFLSPPAWVFPVVWTVLYVLMAVSFAIVFNKRKREPMMRRNAVNIYALNLFFNFFWSIIFFDFGAYLLAFIWLLILWFVIFVMIINYYRTAKAAGLLLVPYLVWVTFAGYLNFGVWSLNR
ncbi:MAG: TspO/MBR family protein [Clostridia bacterium]|nr:TspO/MBR family protein [Clostridia bacterium]